MEQIDFPSSSSLLGNNRSPPQNGALMERVAIMINRNGEREEAELLCDTERLTITFAMEKTKKKLYAGSDFYMCLGSIRQDHPDITFLCKGAKINVHPSTMSSQMTQGVKAYELTLGKRASRTDVVNIFDYEQDNLTNEPEVQERFFRQWMESEVDED